MHDEKWDALRKRIGCRTKRRAFHAGIRLFCEMERDRVIRGRRGISGAES